MKNVVNVYDAKTHLSKLLDRVMGGEEIVIGKFGKPVVRLIPYEKLPARREPGTGTKYIVVSPDVDAPLPDEIIEEFEK